MVKTLSLRELSSLEFPEQPYVIGNGLLPEQALMFIGGPPKSYKSFLLNTIIQQVCCGEPLFGAFANHARTRQFTFPVSSPKRVLMFEQELGLFSLKERLTRMGQPINPEKRELFESNLWLHSLDHSCRLDRPDGQDKIGNIIAEVKPQVVCFDPLIEFHTADENDAQQMTRVLRAIDEMRETLKFATIITHHTGKPSQFNTREGPDLLRGSSSIFGKGDSYIMLKVRNRTSAIIELSFTLRHDRTPRRMLLKLNTGHLTFEFNGWLTRKTELELRKLPDNDVEIDVLDDDDTPGSVQ